MPLQPNEVYIKQTDDGTYTVVFNGKTYTHRDETDIIAVIMHSEGRYIHVFDPDYAVGRSAPMLQHFKQQTLDAEEYVEWLKRRAGS